jgi:formate hydrogenlyase subunit 6/NADH:ubiquinone oxidoreductase subunit I
MGAPTNPRGWRLDRPQLEAWLADLLRAGKEVYAPLERDGARVFAAVVTPADVSLAEGKPRYSPKEIVFPKSELLFSYRANNEGVTLADPPPDTAERVLFAVRPCDAAGLVRLDGILNDDPFYAGRRARMAVVTLGCDRPAPACFCTAVDGAPHGSEGSDVEVLVAPDGVLVRPRTAKGEALVAASAGGWTSASAEDWARADERGQAAAAAILRQPVAKEWAGGLEASFENAAWDEIGRRCLSCSICAYVCPSCSCFDVQDEGSTSCGERCRNWDACSFGSFTQHASGHNPRGGQPSRYRQRLLHKFSYYPARASGQWMCVGCGRCVELCPVGIDIHEAVRIVMDQRGSDV